VDSGAGEGECAQECSCAQEKVTYTKKETWLTALLERAAGGLNSTYNAFVDNEVAEIEYVKAPDLVVYPRAFKLYLERVKLPGCGLTEFQRMKWNAQMFEELIVQVRQEVLAEEEAKEAEAVEMEKLRQEALRIVRENE
jgi:hypothetical protein